MKRTFRLAMFWLCWLGLIVSPLATPPLQMAGAAPSGEPSPQAPNLDCTTSPFGAVLTLGGEKEVFVGYRGGSNPYTNWLAYARLDINVQGQLQEMGNWLSGNVSNTLTNVSQTGGAATDLNGDGKIEFVQSYVDATKPYALVAHRNGLTDNFWMPFLSGATRTQVQAISGDATGDEVHDGEIVFTSRIDSADPTAPNGAVDVRIINGSFDGGLISDPASSPIAFWRSNQITRTYGTLINATVGDFDGDGTGEVAVALRENSNNFMQLIVLKRVEGYSINEGNSGVVATNLKEIATVRLEVPNLLNLKVSAGDVDGDYRDEIILAHDVDDTSNPGFSNQLRVKTFDLHMSAPDAATVVERGTWSFNEPTKELTLSAGDTDADGRAEVVLAYRSFVNPAGLAIRTLDAEQDVILEHNYLRDANNFRSTLSGLSLDVGDLDKDGKQEIVAGFRDQDALLQVVRVNDQLTPATGLLLTGDWRDGTLGRTNALDIAVRLGDWDNDSLKAQYAPAPGGTILCRQVNEPHITGAVFTPPYWQNIQRIQDKFANLGRTRSTGVTTETAITNENSHSFSAYVGVGFDAEAVAGSAKVTGGYEFSASQTRSGGNSTQQIISEGHTGGNSGGFVLFDNTAYNCYSYQLQISAQPQDGAARFCQSAGATQIAREISGWDSVDGLDPQSALQWVPIARDWTSLTMFRRITETVQSSTASGATADRAADGNPDGTFANNSIAQTQAEAAPWWQIDLGSSQSITKIRAWGRLNYTPTLLADYYVFVSDVDFRTISNDPAVLKNDARVRTYTQSITQTQNSGKVRTFLTLDNNLNPIAGRYVRVQLANMGTPRALALAEVQVFGPNHVEPDRYPIAVRDTNPNDSWFEVNVFNPLTQNYEWKRTRGRLLWDGTATGENVLPHISIGSGTVTQEWSVIQNSQSHSAVADSFSHKIRVGAEFDFEVGLIGKVQGGAAYEYTSGLTSETVRTTSWGSGFELGGGVAGFPLVVNGQNVRWPGQCQYGFQPYYYQIIDESTYGYSQVYLLLDYTVPGNRGNIFDLDRTKNLEACRQGTYKTGANTAPQAANDSAATRKNTPVSLFVLANDMDLDNDALNISAVGGPTHGQTAIIGGSIVYTPTQNYTGLDSFGYTISDGVATSNATVTILVSSRQAYLPMLRR